MLDSPIINIGQPQILALSIHDFVNSMFDSLTSDTSFNISLLLDYDRSSEEDGANVTVAFMGLIFSFVICAAFLVERLREVRRRKLSTTDEADGGSIRSRPNGASKTDVAEKNLQISETPGMVVWPITPKKDDGTVVSQNEDDDRIGELVTPMKR